MTSSDSCDSDSDSDPDVDEGLAGNKFLWARDESYGYTRDQTFGEELFSKIFNPRIRSIATRPVSQKVTHITLSKCNTVRIILDLDKVDRDATELTDISFEDIDNLSVKFRSIVQPRMKFVFTNIVSNQLSGSISGRSTNLDMFFRQFKIAGSGQTSVTFRNINIQSNIPLLNFQDIGHIRVIDSHFENIKALDILRATKCHNSMENSRQSEVQCTTDALFLASKYSNASKWNPPTLTTETGRRPRFEETTNFNFREQLPTKPFLPFQSTITNSQLNATASPLSAPITSNPLFIVPMVLFCAVAIIVILVLLFKRYQKRTSQSPSPGPPLRRESPISVLGTERTFERPSYRANRGRESPISLLGVEDCLNSGSDLSDEARLHSRVT